MQRDPSGERGVALILVMFMVMTMSLVGASLTFVSSNETMSTRNYQTTTQTRYAAESGVAAATNYLLNSYVAPSPGGADPIAAYDTTQSPVRWNNAPVVLSSDPAVAANYPIAGTQTAFAANSAGTLTAGSGTTAFVTSATLLTMKMVTDSITGLQFTVQMWRITGAGSIDGAGAAAVQVSAVLETTDKPVFAYAAFANLFFFTELKNLIARVAHLKQLRGEHQWVVTPRTAPSTSSTKSTATTDPEVAA